MRRATKAIPFYEQAPRRSRPGNPNPPRLVLDPATGKISETRASRRTGHAVVMVTRAGHCRRYKVSLRRHAALRARTARLGLGRSSGHWLAHGMCVQLWGTRR